MQALPFIAICMLILCASLAPAAESPPSRLPPTHLQTDEEIHTAVLKGLLANPNVLAGDVRVAVKNGAVTLTGTVRDKEAKAVAEKVALSVPGVQSVKNLLSPRKESDWRDLSPIKLHTVATHRLLSNAGRIAEFCGFVSRSLSQRQRPCDARWRDCSPPSSQAALSGLDLKVESLLDAAKHAAAPVHWCCKRHAHALHPRSRRSRSPEVTLGD